MTTTAGTLLGGRVQYAQPTAGYRTGLEPVLLAAQRAGRDGRPGARGGYRGWRRPCCAWPHGWQVSLAWGWSATANWRLWRRRISSPTVSTGWQCRRGICCPGSPARGSTMRSPTRRGTPPQAAPRRTQGGERQRTAGARAASHLGRGHGNRATASRHAEPDPAGCVPCRGHGRAGSVGHSGDYRVSLMATRRNAAKLMILQGKKGSRGLSSVLPG